MRYFNDLSFWYMLEILFPLRLGIVLLVLRHKVICFTNLPSQIPEIKTLIFMYRLTTGLLAAY
jgi:hypothetical protein